MCMYVYMHVCIYVFMCIFTVSLCTCQHVGICVCMYADMIVRTWYLSCAVLFLSLSFEFIDLSIFSSNDLIEESYHEYLVMQ